MQRFEFGKNWQSFLSTLREDRVRAAERSLAELLECSDLRDKTFLDIGSGSGLISLAARRLGAKVHSFDGDPESVACTSALKARWFPDDSGWTVQQGSILDEDYVASLGRFDVVYCWGVLHHTGNMRKALELTVGCLAEGAVLCLALYNDQGGASRRWRSIKRLYNRLPGPLRPALVLLVAAGSETVYALARLAKGQNPLPFADWKAKREQRGMSVWHDWVDWVGGYPFEVAKPEEVIVPLRRKGLILENLTTCGRGHGCNQYVFRRLGLVPGSSLAAEAGGPKGPAARREEAGGCSQETRGPRG